ncbi:MAG: thioesterase family protein [Caulobacter sp.]|nr:thioesterase family protein [Caulobacter sp.]
MPGLSVLTGVGEAIEIWRGGVNTWECDEMGHMNVRFYVTRAMEGLVGLAAALGLPHAFTQEAGSTLIVGEQHIRFLREAHAGAALHMTGGVIEMTENGARLLQLLWHSDSGALAATFQTVVTHATPAEGRPFAWSERTLARADALRVAVPDQAAARSVSLTPVAPQAGLARADELGLARIAQGAVSPADCDVFGRMRAEQFIGRVSDGIPRLVRGFRDAVVNAVPDQPKRVGGAVLEYRLIHLDWPRAGDRLEVRSGLVDVDARTKRLVHWMVDPDTGKAWGTSEAIAITLDLDARKIVPITDVARDALMKQATPGLSL